MDILLAGVLSCSDGKWILDGLREVEMSQVTKAEMVITIIESMPPDCPDRYYVPGNRS